VRSPACHAIAIWRRRATALFRRGLPRRAGGPSCRPVQELRQAAGAPESARRRSVCSPAKMVVLTLESLAWSVGNMGIVRVAHGARVRSRGAGTPQVFRQTPGPGHHLGAAGRLRGASDFAGAAGRHGSRTHDPWHLRPDHRPERRHPRPVLLRHRAAQRRHPDPTAHPRERDGRRRRLGRRV